MLLITRMQIITDCIWLKTVYSCERSLVLHCAKKYNLSNCRTNHSGVMSAVCKSCWSGSCKHGGWGVSPVFPSTVPTPTHHTCSLYLKCSPQSTPVSNSRKAEQNVLYKHHPYRLSPICGNLGCTCVTLTQH